MLGPGLSTSESRSAPPQSGRWVLLVCPRFTREGPGALEAGVRPEPGLELSAAAYQGSHLLGNKSFRLSSQKRDFLGRVQLFFFFNLFGCAGS